MENAPFSFKKRIYSFRYAINGIKQLIITEHNARIHLSAAIITIGCGIWLGISPVEWMIIIMCIGLVFGAECFNSAVEAISDFVSPEYHNTIKRIKDLAAAGVLCVALASAITGCIIFIPKIIVYFIS